MSTALVSAVSSLSADILSAVRTFASSVDASAMAMDGIRPRHLYIDVERAEAERTYRVIVSGDDKTKAGSKATTRTPELAFNDATGAARLYAVASFSFAEGQEASAIAYAAALQSDLLAFFGAEGASFPERITALADDYSRSIALLITGAIGITCAHANTGSAWRVCSRHAAKEHKRAAHEKGEKASLSAAISAAAQGNGAILAGMLSSQSATQLAVLESMIKARQGAMAE